MAKPVTPSQVPPRAALAARWRRRTQAGQAVVEFALILPLLALLTVGIVDLGRVFYTYEALANAAREGARFCALPVSLLVPPPPGHRPAMAKPFGRVSGELDGRVLVDPTDVLVNGVPGGDCPSSAARGSPVTVTVSAHFGLFTPFMAKVLDPSPSPTCAAPPGDPILGKINNCSEVQDGGERGLRVAASATMVVW
jgi:hypothetical protein